MRKPSRDVCDERVRRARRPARTPRRARGSRGRRTPGRASRRASAICSSLGDVARQHQRVVERRRQLAHVLFEPLARIGQREPRAGRRRRLRDRPRDRPLVGDADDEAVFAGEIGHVLVSRDAGASSDVYFDRLRPPAVAPLLAPPCGPAAAGRRSSACRRRRGPPRALPPPSSGCPGTAGRRRTAPPR